MDWNDPSPEFVTQQVIGYGVLAMIIIGLIWFCIKPRNCTICCLNVLRFCYDWSPLRLNCASSLDPDKAIYRYEEDPPLPRDAFIALVLSNDYIKSILNSFALLLPEYFLSILPSGSLREGFGKVLPSTAVLASDYDVMLVPDAVFVGDADAVFGSGEEPVFAIVESTEIRTGFVWLRLENGYLKQWEKLCIRRQTQGKGCSYLSSHKIHDLLRDVFLQSEWIRRTSQQLLGNPDAGITTVEQNGPALTIKVKNTRKIACGCRCNCCSCCELERDDILFYCDFTVALHCPQWPKKSGWLRDERRINWPSQDVVNEITQIGCHVVPKPSTDSIIKLHEEQPLNTTYSQSPGLEWRYSFSQPEILLSDQVAPQARSAYLALKAVNKRHISQGMIKGLPSYVLKCLLYQFMEEQDGAFWEANPAPIDIFVKLLDALRLNLLNKFFPHYWIEEIDLLSELDMPTQRLLLNNLERVRYKPQAYIADNWLELTRCLRHNCCVCCAFSKKATTSTFISNILARQNTACPCCLVPYSYNDNMLCFGPCPYDRLNMDVY